MYFYGSSTYAFTFFVKLRWPKKKIICVKMFFILKIHAKLRNVRKMTNEENCFRKTWVFLKYCSSTKYVLNRIYSNELNYPPYSITINQTNENLGKALTSRLIKCICIFSIYSNSTQIYALGGFWLLPVALEKFKFSEFLWY